MANVVILGGTGEMGSRVTSRLKASDHDVRAASRASGFDVTSGDGLADAVADADVVIDALNFQTMSKRAALNFFEDGAIRITQAAAEAGVKHLVLLSIVNVSNPKVHSIGYYAAKAAQEKIYAAAQVPVTIVATTAWFTLADTFLNQMRVGSIAVVPRIGLVPVHPDAAADLLAETAGGPAPDHAAADSGPARREIAGPQQIDASAMARGVTSVRPAKVRVLGVPAPPGLGSGLLPGAEVPRDDRRFADWLDQEAAATTS